MSKVKEILLGLTGLAGLAGCGHNGPAATEIQQTTPNSSEHFQEPTFVAPTEKVADFPEGSLYYGVLPDRSISGSFSIIEEQYVTNNPEIEINGENYRLILPEQGEQRPFVNVLFNSQDPEAVAGYQIADSIFNAEVDKSGQKTGHITLGNGQRVDLNYQDGFWRTADGRIINPWLSVIGYTLADGGRIQGYPILTERNGNLFIIIVDGLGNVIRDRNNNVVEIPSLVEASILAEQFGYNGDVRDIRLDGYGNIVIIKENGEEIVISWMSPSDIDNSQELISTPTPTPTVEPTPTPTPTPEPVEDFFTPETFPAEMRRYVETLPNRNNLDPSQAEQRRYLEQDRAFHQFYMEQMVLYLQENGVDTSAFEGWRGRDWLDYDKSIQVYEALWRLLYQEYQETGEYRTDFLLTPWLLRGDGSENLGMYDTRNFVTSINGINGNLGYGSSLSQEQFINYYSASNLQEAMEKWREELREYGVVVPIFGVPTRIERQAAVLSSIGVLTAISDMPGREGVKILVLGFVDENGKWVYQAFAVNLSADTRTQAGDYMYTGGDVVPAPEGYIPWVADEPGSNNPEYDRERLLSLLNHAVVLNADMRYENENGDDIIFSQFMYDGIESAGYISDGGEAENSPLIEQAGGQEEQEEQGEEGD